MIRLSPKYARSRVDAWTEAAWTLWNAQILRDPLVLDSWACCLSMASLWKWLEIALYDQKDRRWSFNPVEVL
jgi:hypothetical protein